MRVTSYTSPNTIIFHNFGSTSEEILPISETEFTKLSESYLFTATVLFTKDTREEVKELPIEQKILRRNKKQKRPDSSQKQKEKKELANLRRKVLENTNLQCKQCDHRTPFRSIRHNAGKREFFIIPYKTYDEALSLFKTQLLTITGKHRGNIDLYSCSNEMDNEIQNWLREIRRIDCFHHSFIYPNDNEVKNLTHLPKHICLDDSVYYSDKYSLIHDISSKIQLWINERQENKTGLPKTREKLKNAVSSLLFVKRNDNAVQSVLPTVMKRLQPSFCPSCSYLHLNSICSYNEFKKTNTTKKGNEESSNLLRSSTSSSSSTNYVIPLDNNNETSQNNDDDVRMKDVDDSWAAIDVGVNSLTDNATQENQIEWHIVPGKPESQSVLERGLNEFEKSVLRRCVEIFSKQKDLPSTIDALASAIVANCTSSEYVEFDEVFSHLLKEGIISQDENYFLHY